MIHSRRKTNGRSHAFCGMLVSLSLFLAVAGSARAADPLCDAPIDSVQVTKFCSDFPPDSGDDFECEDADIHSVTLAWGGDQDILVTAWFDKVGKGDPVLVEKEVEQGSSVTITRDDKELHKIYFEVFDLGGAKIGDSVFDAKCHNETMNGPEDCGTRQGDGKNNRKEGDADKYLKKYEKYLKLAKSMF